MTDDVSGLGEPEFGAQGQSQYAMRPGPQRASQAGGPASPQAVGKGFLSALFDFSFNSYVTPTVVKVLYILIVIVAGLSSLGFAAVMFGINAIFGILSLLVLSPLFFLITTALYRISLEMFMIIFRIAEDTRAIRDQGGR